MPLKYKLTILALVVSLAAAVLILTNQDTELTDEIEIEHMAIENNSTSQEEMADIDEEFKPAADPYQAYLDARDAGSPIVLEFYARW